MPEASSALSILRVPKEGSDRALNHLDRLSSGDPKDYRAPFLDDLDRSDVVDLLNKEVLDEQGWPPGLEQIETEQQESIGPLSPVLPYGEWSANVDEYFLPHTNVPVSTRAFESVLGLFRGIKFQPKDIETAFRSMPKDTNLGLPWFTRRKDFAESYRQRAVKIQSEGFSEDAFPAFLALRKQMDGTQFGKHRPVWAMDHVETILGLRVQNAILEFARGLPEFAAWNDLDTIDATVTRILEIRRGIPILSIDFSGYDRNLSDSLIDQAFDVLVQLFPSARSLIEWLRRQFKTVGLLTPEGLKRGKDGGVPSGSALTNLIDSICQLLLFYEIAVVLKVKAGPVTVMGDDGLWNFDPMPGLDEIGAALSEYGMTSNPDKQMLEMGRVVFLQRLHTVDWMPDGLARGIRPLSRTFGSMISFERSPDPAVWTGEMHLLREISQLENNKWHPDFEKSVRLLNDRDKLLQSGVDPVDALNTVGGAEALKSALKRPSFPFGVEDESGLNKFETVKILRAVA